MRFQNVLLASLLGLATAFTIPEGTADGAYEHFIDANGSDVHVQVETSPSFTDGAAATSYIQGSFPARFKRAEDVAHCGVGGELNHKDTDDANAELDWQCDHLDPTKPRHNFYVVKGDMVAFFCNFDYISSHQCSSASRRYTSSLITQKCGWYRQGWTTYAPHDTSYGYTGNGRFCQ